MSIAKAKVPASVVSGIVCLMLGIAAGVVVGGLTTSERPVVISNSDEAKAKTPGGGGGGKAGPGGQKGGGPPAKTQLTQFVGKLELLTRKPAIKLSAEQKQKLKELLADIDAKDDMTQDEARTRLDALVKIVEEHRQVLESAGFAWPGAPGVPQTNPPPNPFHAGPASQDVISLKALRAVLDAKE